MNDDKSPNGVEAQEINLFDLVAVILKRKGIILIITVAALIISVIVSLLLPDVYTATAKVLPPQKESVGVLSALSNIQGGRLTAVMGGDNTGLYLGILKSRSVEDVVIRRFGLTKLYEADTPEETRKALQSKVRMQAGNGIITIDVEDKDPRRAAAMANGFVEELGRISIQLNLIAKSFPSLVLDEAVVPTKKSKPRRSLIIILSTGIAFFIGIFLAFIWEYVEKIMPAEKKAIGTSFEKL
jgi:tyrosine-protein kinase Etk/Wzc